MSAHDSVGAEFKTLVSQAALQASRRHRIVAAVVHSAIRDPATLIVQVHK